MMTCRELIDFLIDYHEGSLDTATRGEFDRHLSLCPPCRRYLESYLSTIALAKASCEDSEHTLNTDSTSTASNAPKRPPMPEELVSSILRASAMRSINGA